MGLDVKKAAQQRVDRIAQFQEELALLETEGGLALTPEQRRGLDSHLAEVLQKLQAQFGVDASESARRVSWGMRVASLLGGAALFAALVLFLGRVWGNLPVSMQVLVLTAGPVLLLAGAEFASRRGAAPYYVALLAFAASVAFVMGTNSLGEVLNLADSPHALLSWGLFALLLSYAYSLRLLLAAGLFLLCIYSGALLASEQGHHWLGVFQRTQCILPAAALVYSVPWLIRGRGPRDFDPVFRLTGAATGLLVLLIFSLAGDLCLGTLSPGQVESSYQLAGLVLSGAVVSHGLRLGQVGLVNVGSGAFLVFLFIRLHSWWWNWMPKYVFFLVIALIAFGLLLVFRRFRLQLTRGGAA